jgi:Rhodopirellula transposase DDE domain
MQDATAGDPMKELKWTHKSLRTLCRALRRQGFRIGRDTIARYALTGQIVAICGLGQ